MKPLLQIVLIIGITFLSGYVMYKIDGCIQRANVRDVLKENPCPTAKSLDPKTIKNIWALGMLAGTKMMTKSQNGDPRDAWEMHMDFWPKDSMYIQILINQ